MKSPYCRGRYRGSPSLLCVCVNEMWVCVWLIGRCRHAHAHLHSSSVQYKNHGLHSTCHQITQSYMLCGIYLPACSLSGNHLPVGSVNQQHTLAVQRSASCFPSVVCRSLSLSPQGFTHVLSRCFLWAKFDPNCIFDLSSCVSLALGSRFASIKYKVIIFTTAFQFVVNSSSRTPLLLFEGCRTGQKQDRLDSINVWASWWHFVLLLGHQLPPSPLSCSTAGYLLQLL